MILLDTSVLIDALTGPRRSAAAVRRAIDRGERVMLATIVLCEWLRGPRRAPELTAQETLWPREHIPAFGPNEASVAADLYRAVRSPRGREIDLAVAACAICWNAHLWTLNLADFRDVPGLSVSLPE